MQMRSGCLFRSPCCGNASVLKLFLGGEGFQSSLVCAPPWVVRRLSVLRCVGSFFAYMWGEKKSRGSPKCAGHQPNSRRCGPDLKRQCLSADGILISGR